VPAVTLLGSPACPEVPRAEPSAGKGFASGLPRIVGLLSADAADCRALVGAFPPAALHHEVHVRI